MFTSLLLLWIGSQSAPPATPKCDAAEHRQFDFWLGDWQVAGPNGQVFGRNVIRLEIGSCVVHEHWTGSAGLTGESFNIWDRSTRKWHQTWVSSDGGLLLLDGEFRDGAMRMSGQSRSASGEMVSNRITWTPQADSSVRQLWETSTDDGRTWTTVFDGIYRRASK